jgi:hypothetical protein
MRAYSLLMTFALAFVVLLGLQLFSGQTFEADISAVVDIDPDTLNLQMHGRWITVYVELPAGYNVSDIDIGTVKLERILNASRWNIQDNRLMLKFDAEQVVGLVWSKIYHIGEPTPQDKVTVELTVTGELYSGITFEGSDEIRVIVPP